MSTLAAPLLFSLVGLALSLFAACNWDVLSALGAY
jgi:hypothetical protein